MFRIFRRCFYAPIQGYFLGQAGFYYEIFNNRFLLNIIYYS